MKEKLSSGKLYCLISAVLVFGAYIIQKVLSLTIEPSKLSLVSQALVFSLFVAIVYFLISKSEETFYGMLMAVFGIRMLPPEINALADFSAGANIIYYIVSRVSVLIFTLVIIKLYRDQREDKKVSVIALLSSVLIVPFFNETGERLSSYVNAATNGNMYFTYFILLASYVFALMLLLFVAVRSDKESAKFICDFQIVALLLNAGRRLCAIIITLSAGNHISKSYYCYLATYIFFIAVFFILKSRKEKN